MKTNAPERIWLCPQNYEAATACGHPSDTEYIRADLNVVDNLREQLREEQNRNQIQADTIMERDAEITALRSAGVDRGWQPIEDRREYGTFEVWLETPDRTLNSQVGIANIHKNATIINGHFSYDMPKILYVRPLPDPPSALRTSVVKDENDSVR